MAEGFNDENPVTRGHRDPDLQAQMDADDFDDAGQSNETDVVYVGLFPGDTVLAKVTLFAKTQLGDAWFVLGTQSRLADGESAEGAYTRVTDIITEEVMRFGQKQLQAIEDNQDQGEPAAPSRSRGRITPR
jgi:hypothetical protein